MALNAQFCTLSAECGTKEVKDRVKAEAKTSVSGEGVARILDVKARTVITGSEVAAGQVRYSGRTVFAVLYETSEGELKKCECGAEFSGSVGKVEDNASCYVTARCVNATAELASTLIARCDVEICASVYCKTQHTLLTGGESVITRNKDFACAQNFRAKKTAVSIDEEFELNYGVKDVVFSRTECAVISATSAAGTLIVDGELYLTLLLLQKIENSDILKERRVIPFRIEAECPEAMPSQICGASVAVKSTKFDIVVDEETGKSNVTFMCETEADGFVSDTVNQSPAVDAYSTENEVILDYTEVQTAFSQAQKTAESRFSQRAVFDTAIEAGARLMTCSDDGAEIVRAEIANGNLSVDCIMNATAYLKNLDGKTEIKKFAVPLTFTLACEGERVADISVAAADFYARIVSLNEVETGGTLKITYRTEKNNIIKCVSKIEEGGKKSVSNAAISVYIPEKGEDLWTVSKRLNASPEKLSRLNPDLEFPLTGDERIVVFREKQRDYQ